ncbi:hypothetical protein, partial [Pseudomonas poae]|uniref:hypothetical protein n=1 Tax=Pseudomonas poae TaxID=200451 RepID=UPI0034D64945
SSVDPLPSTVTAACDEVARVSLMVQFVRFAAFVATGPQSLNVAPVNVCPDKSVGVTPTNVLPLSEYVALAWLAASNV